MINFVLHQCDLCSWLDVKYEVTVSRADLPTFCSLQVWHVCRRSLYSVRQTSSGKTTSRHYSTTTPSTPLLVWPLRSRPRIRRRAQNGTTQKMATTDSRLWIIQVWLIVIIGAWKWERMDETKQAVHGWVVDVIEGFDCIGEFVARLTTCSASSPMALVPVLHGSTFLVQTPLLVGAPRTCL